MKSKMLNRPFPQSNRSIIKSIFAKYPLESVLLGLWGVRDGITGFEKACATSLAIEFSRPSGSRSEVRVVDKTTLLQLVKDATSFCLNNDEDKKYHNGSNEIFYEVFSLMANQLTVSRSFGWDFARALLMYVIIPSELEDNNDIHNMLNGFVEDKGYSVNEYIQVCFIAMSGVYNDGKFTDRYLEDFARIMNVPSFDKMNAVLFDISASAVHYRRERKLLNFDNSFKYQPIAIYPLIKPWSDIPKKHRGKMYMCPLPELIGHKANIGLYYYFLSKYHLGFTRVFGKEIFERYVERALSSCCCKEELKDEAAIKNDYKIPQGVKLPDFLVVKGQKGVIVECKAAVLPLTVSTNGDMADFKNTVAKINKGVLQVANFEGYAFENSFYGVSEWNRLIVTYEPLWGINSDLLSELLISDFLHEEEALTFTSEFEKTQVLSLSELDHLLIHTSETHSLFSILSTLQNSDFNTVLKELVETTGKTFRDSHLSQYMDLLKESVLLSKQFD